MQIKKVEAILGLGTNIGPKINNLTEAILCLKSKSIEVVAESKIYKTPPWGFQADEYFYNMAIKIETTLSPFQLLIEVKAIEMRMGRTAKLGAGYESRIIDIDIIDFDKRVFKNADLVVPHPLIADRIFVLYPLRDIAENYHHPESGKSIEVLIANLNDVTATVVNKME